MFDICKLFSNVDQEDLKLCPLDAMTAPSDPLWSTLSLVEEGGNSFRLYFISLSVSFSPFNTLI